MWHRRQPFCSFTSGRKKGNNMGATSRLVHEYVRAHPVPFVADVLAVTGVPLLELAVLPLLYGMAVAAVGGRRPLGWLFVGIALVFTAIGVLHHVRDLAVQYLVPGLEAHLKLALTDRLLRAEPCHPRSTGDLVRQQLEGMSRRPETSHVYVETSYWYDLPYPPPFQL
jgi:hypothetical protein